MHEILKDKSKDTKLDYSLWLFGQLATLQDSPLCKVEYIFLCVGVYYVLLYHVVDGLTLIWNNPDKVNI